jgi:oligopeptidase B
LVPVTILHHASTKLDGTAPCLLYGYGSYGASMPAGFSSNRLSLVDRGFIYAIAHIRGGEEKGRAWYEDAKFGRKVNTFHDFIAAAEALATHSYTATGRIVAQGGSAGGLLVGAVVNMRPDLWAGAIADVPFVDVLNTILDDTLPLTPGEWSQWGNPITSKTAFDDIRGYSPYDNVTAQAYPAMLVTAGVSDPRVTYWEPAKWVAKLRVTKADDNILLLRTNMTSGHFGKTGRFAALEDAARSYTFAIKAVGLA